MAFYMLFENSRSLLEAKVINGNNGPNERDGTSKPDDMFGFGGNDILRGHGDNDRLYGGDDDDQLFGGTGNDKLYGEKGADDLYGAKGRDILEGGKGNDNLYGGADEDRFYFKGGKTGKDFIYDFKDNVDTLYISRSYGFDSVQDVIDACHPSGGDTPIDLSGTGNQNLQIILLGYDLPPEKLANDIVLIA